MKSFLNDEQIRKILIHLDRIADAIEKQNQLKEKELEYWKYNAELELKKFEKTNYEKQEIQYF